MALRRRRKLGQLIAPKITPLADIRASMSRLKCWKFVKFSMWNFTKPMENSEPNLDEQESIFLIDYTSCSLLFTRVNQPTLVTRSFCYTMIIEEEKMNWGRKGNQGFGEKRKKKKNLCRESSLFFTLKFYSTMQLHSLSCVTINDMRPPYLQVEIACTLNNLRIT